MTKRKHTHTHTEREREVSYLSLEEASFTTDLSIFFLPLPVDEMCKLQPMGQDDWDKKLVERDVRILEEARLKKEQDKKKVSGYAELNKGRKWYGIW